MHVSESKQDTQEIVASLIQKPKLIDKVAEALGDASRRGRQNAAAIMSELCRHKPELALPYIEDIEDALNRPEARTRWECLDALTILVDHDSRACEKAIPDAEVSLFDEENGFVRLAALRFLCRIGATTAVRSEKTWPMIDEALQCYHGDIEYGDMLNAVVDYSHGKLSDQVKHGLADRVRFDAENSKGSLQRKSRQIIDNLDIEAEGEGQAEGKDSSADA